MEEQKSNNNLVLSGIVIEYRKSDNFINATQLCKAGGKRFGDWISLKTTKELIKELENLRLNNSLIRVLASLYLVWQSG